MSSYRGDHYSPPSRQQGSHGRSGYQQPFGDAPPDSLDPLDPLSNVQRPKGYPERDNGWGRRRPRADSQAAPSRPVEPYQRAVPSASEPRTLPPPPNHAWDTCSPASEALPRHRPPVADPRRPLTPPQRYGHGSAVPSPSDPRTLPPPPDHGWDSSAPATEALPPSQYNRPPMADPRPRIPPPHYGRAAHSTPTPGHPPPVHRESDGRRSRAEDQQVLHSAPFPASSPGFNARPATSDPRRPSASSSHGWEPQPALVLDVPPSYPVISQEEVKLEYTLRMIEGRLNQQLAVPAPEWEGVDTKLITQLIEEHQGLKTLNTMRPRTMHTAMSHYCVMIECMAANRAHPTAQEKLTTIRNGVQNIVFDICEDESVGTRKQGHRALLELSSRDITLLTSNLTALVELMQNHDDDERTLVREVILKHFRSAQQSDYPEASVTSCFDLMFGDKLELRGLVVDFFASDWGQKVVDTIVGELTHEAALAKHLAETLPLATKFALPKVVSLLHDLQSIWVGPDDELSESDREAAREAAVAVLWNLGWILMVKHNLSPVPPGHSSEDDQSGTSSMLSPALTDVLAEWDGSSKIPLITDGLKTFSSLLQVVDRTMLGRGEQIQLAAVQKLSEAKIFLNELDASTTYLFYYLPLEEGAIEEPAALVHHFSAAQKLVLFRSASNLAARVASTAKQCPPELAFAGGSTASDISKIIARALMTHVPINGVSCVRIGDADRSPAVTRARKAYTMLASEALLTALDQCRSTIERPTWIDGHFQDRVKDIIGLAREVEERELYPEEVRESAGSVIRLGQRCLRDARRSDAEQPIPTWLIPPPPFPQWVNPLKAQEEASSSNAELGKGKRRADSEDVRRVRGRGAVRAFGADARDADVKVEHKDAGPPSPTEKGIAIKGSSQAGRPAVESRRDVKTEDWGTQDDQPSLLDRIDDRKMSNERGQSSTSHYRARTEDRRDSQEYRSRRRDDDAYRRGRHRDEGYYEHYDRGGRDWRRR
ncbi:hypothetical protein PSEUBRA_005789 [Kalmanozyma brasiliensis GHG001]|uniref:uncharacterized protein n=1 Tax=Kalmanozyma brasiliensis (strain GHG001) TaxID=1365824 RepID=UPI002867EA61|nr:uncharacterized protein PSEUBRA_005789 [Kalmanozyma brasiliensis GHG001]KAF6767557.1 hypothetical protein PSEUBRA_005789 [Kalmanozyma brasiliensis GHG001]